MSGHDLAAPRVLVLMATYNGAPWIEEQLASIFAQEGVALVVRVSDDRSSDATPDVVRRLAAGRDDLVLSCRASASGSAGANFKGLLAEVDLAGFDYVAFADQDDRWERDHLLRACRAQRGGGYSCAVRTFGDGDSVVLAQDGRMRALDFLFEGAGQGCTFVLSHELALRAQDCCRRHPALAAAMHYHDWLVYLVARTAHCAWVFDPQPGLAYRQHGANEIGARSGRAAIARRLALIRDGWFKQQIAAALALARVLAPADALLARFGAVFDAVPSLRRRLALVALVLRHGRRRSGDRIVLAVAALAGWI